MSFRCRQTYNGSSCGAVCALEETTLETGTMEVSSVDLCKKNLPEPELFDLESNIKAKVNLDEVNSKILSSPAVDIPALTPHGLEITEKQKIEEVNDEN